MKKEITDYTPFELMTVVELKDNYQYFLVEKCLKELLNKGLPKEKLKDLAGKVLQIYISEKLQARDHFTSSSINDIESNFLTNKEIKSNIEIAFNNHINRLDFLNHNLPSSL